MVAVSADWFDSRPGAGSIRACDVNDIWGLARGPHRYNGALYFREQAAGKRGLPGQACVASNLVQ